MRTRRRARIERRCDLDPVAQWRGSRHGAGPFLPMARREPKEPRLRCAGDAATPGPARLHLLLPVLEEDVGGGVRHGLGPHELPMPIALGAANSQRTASSAVARWPWNQEER